MRLYTFVLGGKQRLGAEADGRLIDLAAAAEASGAPASTAFGDMVSLIQAGVEGMDAACEALTFAAEHLEVPGISLRLNEARLCAPLPRPGKILCSGVNYLGHLTENPGATLPKTPGFFAKLPSAVIGPGEPIVHPKLTQQLDYEVELAVVIGQTMRRTPQDQAMSCIFGYTILHDVSARDVQFTAPQPNQITLAKNFDTFAPMGPCIVTADELPEPAELRLRTSVNGRVLQDGSNSDWVFPLPRLLSFLSAVMTLEPGDVVTTGTPAGVGVFQRPQVFLKPGDRTVLEIDRIGRLENPVVAEE